MANPVLIAKLALVAADPKTWQKIIIACISIFILSLLIIGTRRVPTTKIFEEKEVKNNEKTHHKAQFR